MRLQTKLTLAFAVGLVPIALVGSVARVLVANQYRAQFRATLDESERDVDREYARLSDDVVQATARIARKDDPTIGKLLVELGKGPLDDDTQSELADYVTRQMKTLGFDVLEIVDARGVVLACGHFAGRVGDSDPAALQVARHARGQARLVSERVVEGGRVEPVLALEVAAEVQGNFGGGGLPPRVVVIGGRRLGAPFLERLHHAARLLAPDGSVLVGGATPAPARYPRRLVALRGDGGAIVARVEIVVPDDELVRTLAWIGWASLALGLSATALALLAGFLVARRMIAPLAELAGGVRAVSRGQLDTTVAVRTRDEIGELAASFNTMTRDLQGAREELVRAERVAAWREIAQRIAHEIKNPLTPIQMAIETLQRAKLRADAKLFDELFAESSRTILDEVARLKHIVGEFGSFARMPAPRLAACDVGEVVDATLALYHGGAGGPTVERALAPSLPRALADRDQLVQVLLNLLENARDAVSGAGRIVVRTRAANGRVELEVADSGPGLSDETRARLFTPYYTTKAKGTGLGLAIVHRIVSDHGGEIRVANDGGAVFTVSLPVAP